MHWDLGLNGLLYLAAMSIGFGLLVQLLAWRAGPKWLWAVVSAAYFAVGIFASEVLFGWATGEDLQPNIDGLSRDEVLLIGLVPVVLAVVIARWSARRHTHRSAHEHEQSLPSGRGRPTPHAS